MFSMKYVFVCLALSCAAGAVSAKGVFYDCDITRFSHKSNWIANKIGFVFENSGTVKVVDGPILHFMKEPQVARVRKRGGDAVRINWLLSNITSSTKQPMAPAKYSADLNRKTLKVKVYATSSAFAGAKMSGSGTCKARKR